ncbi:MAG: flagellar biosynthetic protein FliO [Burkholderiales bacterium]|nr:flagellar biosynthetic protein FliO [Burkholderiales bacterium]
MNRAGRALYLCLTVATACSTVSVLAAEPPAVPPSGSVFGMVQVVFALLLVLGAIGLFAWLLRRFAPGQASAGGMLKVVGGVMVGPRERLVVIEVQDTWLLLGVASGHVSLVHSMPRPAGDAIAPSAPAGFARVMSQVRAARAERR